MSELETEKDSEILSTKKSISNNSNGSEGSEEIVKDKHYKVYYVLMFLGFGALLPWNMFVNISFDYYETFKFLNNGNQTWYSTNFQNVMTISAQAPSFIVCVASVFSAPKGDLSFRMLICLVVVELVIVITTIFIYIDTSLWIAEFFFMTIASIILLNSANGLFQNSMFGLASPFPFEYTNSIIIGQNLCGMIVTVSSIITRAVSNDIRSRCLIYFLIASAVIALSFILLQAIKSIEFYKKHGICKQNAENDYPERSKFDDMKMVFSKCWLQFFNIFAIFFVTLSVYPNVVIYVQDAPKGEKYSFFIPENYFMDVTSFLNFNVFAFVGSLTASKIQIPGPKTIWIPIVMRFWFVFYFAASNYLPYDRTWPVLFYSTWGFIGNQTILAFTSGYFSSLVMMYAPQTCPDPHSKRLTGMIASFFLILGILTGLIASWIIKIIITST